MNPIKVPLGHKCWFMSKNARILSKTEAPGLWLCRVIGDNIVLVEIYPTLVTALEAAKQFGMI